jgi:hypothetical protein
MPESSLLDSMDSSLDSKLGLLKLKKQTTSFDDIKLTVVSNSKSTGQRSTNVCEKGGGLDPRCSSKEKKAHNLEGDTVVRPTELLFQYIIIINSYLYSFLGQAISRVILTRNWACGHSRCLERKVRSCDLCYSPR